LWRLSITLSRRFICGGPDIQCNCLWRWNLWQVIRVRWYHGHWALIPEDSCKKLYQRACSLSLSARKGHKRRWWPFASRKRKEALSRPDQLAQWSQTSSFYNCEEINFCCGSHPVYGILLWQSKLTKVVIKPLSLMGFTEGLSIFSHLTSGKSIVRKPDARFPTLIILALSVDI
jgi:hypothetical protein